MCLCGGLFSTHNGLCGLYDGLHGLYKVLISLCHENYGLRGGL